jgi:hypothetical protein
MDYLPQMSGGQIGINHCHILDFIKNNNMDNTLIATSYSEIIFSLLVDCKDSKELYFNDILEYVKESVLNTIKDDYDKINNNFIVTKQFSTVREYFYQTEKHVKFHEYLSYNFNCLIKINNPFTDYDLLKYVMSIPNNHKCKKLLQDYILENYFKLDIDNISSSRFEWNTAGSAITDWYKFKFLNKINAVLRPLTKGHIQLFNKYQTEEQDRLLYRDFHKDLKDATHKFVKLGLMNEEQKKSWDKLPLRSSGIGERFGLISLGKLI